MDTEETIRQIDELTRKAIDLEEQARVCRATISVILDKYAEENRKYPRGFATVRRNRNVTLGDAYGLLSVRGLEIAYQVLYNGEPFDTVTERNIQDGKD